MLMLPPQCASERTYTLRNNQPVRAIDEGLAERAHAKPAGHTHHSNL